jgi:chromosome segregation ATPase
MKPPLHHSTQTRVVPPLPCDIPAQVKSQTIKDGRLRDQLKKKIKEQEDARADIERQRDMLKQEILQLEREIDEQRRQIEIDRKTIEEMGRERDLLQNNLRKTESATSKQADLVKIQENTRKNLEVEIQGYKAEAQKQRQIIYGLEKEREKYGQQASDATSKYMQVIQRSIPFIKR